MKLKSALSVSLVISLVVAAKAAQLARADSFIIGGSEVPQSDPIARGTVALLMQDGQGVSLCTGSLVSSSLIVTAAHCLADQPKKVLIVFSNEISRSSLQNAAVAASRYVVDPEYRGDRTGPDQNDVALVQFRGGLPAGYEPNRILDEGNESLLRDGQEVVLAGYGISDAMNQTGAGILRETTVQVADGNFGRTEILLSQQKGHGACHGDSGGPVFLEIRSTLYLWGITSRAYPDNAPDDCAHEAVYTKIMDSAQFLKEAAAALGR